MSSKNKHLVARWYFGGIAATLAAVITHPFDTLKVHLQMNQGRMTMFTSVRRVVQEQGFSAMYNGLSAAIFRQMTYSTTRFAIYDDLQRRHGSTSDFLSNLAFASIAGAVGGFIGTPADIVNVRMQNDLKLQPEHRRNYRNVFHGLISIYKDGFKKLFTGASTTIVRSMSLTVAQLSFYDLIKNELLRTKRFDDNFNLHVTTSLFSGGVASFLSHPVDVVKTRYMNAKPGVYNGTWDVVKDLSKLGPLAFYKGIMPSLLRPQTLFTFVILEQLRLNFGFEIEE